MFANVSTFNVEYDEAATVNCGIGKVVFVVEATGDPSATDVNVATNEVPRLGALKYGFVNVDTNCPKLLLRTRKEYQFPKLSVRSATTLEDDSIACWRYATLMVGRENPPEICTAPGDDPRVVGVDVYVVTL